MLEILSLILSLYVSIPDLSYLKVVNDRFNESDFNKKRFEFKKDLHKRLGSYNYYKEVFDPWVDKDSLTGSLSDDLFDIYSDLRYVSIINTNSDVDLKIHTLQDLSRGFDHWGEHVSSAIRALYSVVARERSKENHTWMSFTVTGINLVPDEISIALNMKAEHSIESDNDDGLWEVYSDTLYPLNPQEQLEVLVSKFSNKINQINSIKSKNQ